MSNWDFNFITFVFKAAYAVAFNMNGRTKPKLVQAIGIKPLRNLCASTSGTSTG